MAAIHDFDPDDESGIYTWNRFTNYMSGLTAMNILQIAVWLIGLFTLLSGIVGVSNIMFVSVRERTHEIGIRRAIGAKPRDIIVQILSEGVMLTAVAGVAGITLATVALGITQHLTANEVSTPQFQMQPGQAMLIMVTFVVLGTIAGVIPARKAMKIKPVEALNDK